MRRASSSLRSHVSRIKVSSPQFLSFLLSPPKHRPLPSSLSPLQSPPLTFFPKCPFQTLSPAAAPPPPPKSIIFPSFDSLISTDQILAAFSSLDSFLKRGSLAPDDLLQALNFTLKALNFFEGNDSGASSIPAAKALLLAGSISCKLNRFDDSLESLNTAVLILDGSDSNEAKMIGLELQLELAQTNSSMGRKFDALISLKKALELRKSLGPLNCRELGSLYKDLAEAYALVSVFKEASFLCLKGVGILEANCGHNSVEVAQARQLLSIIHVGLEEYNKALEQNELARGIFKGLDLEGDLLDSEIEAANIMIAMGRAGDGIEILKRVIQRVEDKGSERRAFVFVAMAKALFSQEKFGESKRCLEIACGVLDKLDSTSSSRVYECYAEISMLYEMMSDFEMALPLMKRTLAIVERLPREKHLEGSISARMGWLLLLTQRADQAIPYLERGAKRLKDSFGEMHFGLGFVNKHLGQAYLEVDKPSEAVLVLETAYDIIAKWFGAYHEDSIDACQSLANAYAAKAISSPPETMQKHYCSAMEFQQRVIHGWKRHGDNACDELREAYRLFEQLKRKAEGSPSAVFPAHTLPLSLTKGRGKEVTLEQS